MFKNKSVKIVLGVVLVIIVLVGGYFMLAKRSKTTTEPTDQQQQEIVQKLSPDDIGLTISANATNKGVKFAISKLDGIKSIEYQVTYEADSTAAEQSEGGEARVQRGITGEAKLTSSSSYESPWLDLGSCSKNICRYDTGVKSVSLMLKIVKSDGKTYSVEKSLTL